MTYSNEPSLDVNLRLVRPQWHGGGTVSVQEFASEFPFGVGRRGYAVGSAVLEAHPDVGTGQSEYPGYHAMAVSVLTGHGDLGVQAVLPATVTPDRVALVGLHSWTDDDYPHLAEWDLRSFSPDEMRESSAALLAWLASTGCTRVAIHFDVDTIDSNEIVLGLGAEPNGLTSRQVRRIVTDIDQAVDVVGLTIAEFIPRQVMHLQQIVKGFPLIDGSAAN
jgi:arginase